MGHQADDSPWQVTGTSGQSSEVRGSGASTVASSEHRNILQKEEELRHYGKMESQASNCIPRLKGSSL